METPLRTSRDEPEEIPVWLYAGLLAGASPLHFLYAFIAVGLVSLVGIAVAPLFGSTNVGFLYLLPVFIAAVRWGRRPSFFAAILGVMAFDFLFVPPAFHFAPTDPKDYFILVVFLVVAFVTGTIATQLRNERERLRALTSRLESIMEKERAAVAREIHDGLGHALTGIKLDLAQLSKKLPKDEPSLTAHVKSLGDAVDDTIKIVRKISTELRPGVLDEFGLTAAIEWQVEDLATKMGVGYKVMSSLNDTGLDGNISTAIFRILQEALTNIVRHARATFIKTSIREVGGFVILKVEDDGIGITEQEIHDPSSLGLIGIRERAFILGGEVQISGKKGKGTSLVVRIPIKRDGENRA